MSPSEHSFDTYAAYRSAMLEVLGAANRTVVLFDPDLRETGLESAAGIATLEAVCAGASREDSVRILVHSADFIERDCPRLLVLLLKFQHRMRVRVSSTPFRHWTRPFLVADDLHLVTRFHQDAPRGKLCRDDADAVSGMLAQFETMWSAGRAGPSGAPLGI